jgi:hypothetical protein
MASEDPWKDSQTLEQYVFHLFETRQMDSVEFKAMLRVYGKEKIKDFWKKYKDLKKNLV